MADYNWRKWNEFNWGGSDKQKLKEDRTDILEKVLSARNTLSEAVPLAKTGLAEDISEAALYLASDAGKFVTCHDLVVDGGRSVAYNEPQSD